MPHKPGTGAIFGVVSEDGQPKEGAPVTLLDMRREQGIGQSIILARQLSAADGGFVFNGLNTSYGDYAVYCSDEDGVEPKNALIRDRITPVPAHSGSTWLYNWHANACLLGANAILAPYPVIDSAAPRTFEFPSGGGQLVCMDADSMPSMQGGAFANNAPYPLLHVYSDAHIGVHGRPIKAWSSSAEVTYTIEWWVDFSSIGGGTSDPTAFFGARSTNSNSSYHGFRSANLLPVVGYIVSPICCVSISRTTKQITAKVVIDGSIYDSKYFNVVASYLAQLLTYNASALSGVHQLVVVYRSGGTSELLIDGNLVATNTASPAALENGNVFGTRPSSAYFPIIIGGVSTDATRALGADFLSGPVAFYPVALTSAQILQQYQNMTQETLPVMTGYVRKVFEYFPVLYYRLNDTLDSGVLLNWACLASSQRLWQHLPYVGNVGSCLFAESSPVLGGGSVKFPGSTTTYFVTDKGGLVSIGNHHQMTFAGWCKLSATPSVESVALEARNWDNRKACYLAISTSKKLVFTIDIAGTDQAITFSEYDVPLNIWQFVVVVVSLYDSSRTIKLYVGTDTTAPTLVATRTLTSGYMADVYTISTYQPEQYRVAVGYGFPGWLSELAIFPQALSDADIQALWEAKDAV